MSAGFRIIDAKMEHLNALEALEKLCFSVPWTRGMLAAQIDAPDGVFIAAETKTAGIIAYAGFRSVLDEGYITNIAVHPDFRRGGIADALLATLLARAWEMGLTFLTLEVRESNAPAVALYEKHGFVRVGLRPDYYDKPREAAVLMTRRQSLGE